MRLPFKSHEKISALQGEELYNFAVERHEKLKHDANKTIEKILAKHGRAGLWIIHSPQAPAVSFNGVAPENLPRPSGPEYAYEHIEDSPKPLDQQTFLGSAAVKSIDI